MAEQRNGAGQDDQPGKQPATAEEIAADDPHKAEKLSKLGHEDDAPEGSE